MTTDQTLLDIKKELRAAMNGVVSAKMREAGMPFKLIFGVELPRLQSIASEFQPNRELAQQLWNQNIRECKILAAMLMPPTDMLPEVADIWADEIPTPEIAQTLSMYLFCLMPHAADLAFMWIATDHPMRQLCGFLVIARLLSGGAELNEWSLCELKDQALASLPGADLHLKKAIRAVTDRIADVEEEQKKSVPDNI